MMSEYVIPFEKLRNADVAIVGGKNASLGEMISQLDAKGVRVPTGFATTSTAFNDFLKHSELEIKINTLITETIDLHKKLARMEERLVLNANAKSTRKRVKSSNGTK